MFIHKETFFQPGHDGVPSHWVVQYWEDDPNSFCSDAIFENKQEAEIFESTLISYDDWYTSQEIPLAVQ